MKIIIHRGTHEIGGSCIELISGESRILLDFGMPLVDSEQKKFDSKLLSDKTLEELKRCGVLPNIRGLYRGDERSVDAIFITHSHLDHYGFLQYIHPDIPIYASEGAQELITITSEFTPSKINIANRFHTLKTDGTDHVGGFSVTNFLVDHSAFDARAFLIEADGKRLFYTGDFRAHGRKGKLFENMVNHPPEDIDCLIMEGSLLGRGAQKYKDENSVEKRILEILDEKHKVSFLFVSSQNIDRLVSAFRACVRRKATFIIDLYTAYILYKLAAIAKNIPQFDWNNVRVYFFKNQADTVARLGGVDLLYRFNKQKIKLPEINSMKDKVLMIMRDNSLFLKIADRIDGINGSKIIYSMWNGYLKPESVEKWAAKGINLEEVHTSGHAVVADLVRFAKAVNPKIIIPVHTFEPGQYKQLYDKVTLLNDGESYAVK